jgi:hypothetical protein
MLLVFAAAAFAAVAGAAEMCDSTATKKDEDWVKSSPHSWLANVEHKQDVELPRTWCHIWEARAIDRLQKVSTSDAFCSPAMVCIPRWAASYRGADSRAGWSLTWSAHRPRSRFAIAAASKRAVRTNGFWMAGGKLDIFGSKNSAEDRHIHATLDFEHYELPQLTYFGLGNGSSLANESLFGLSQSTGGGHIAVPLPGGFVVVGGLAGLENRPAAVPGASLPSIEQKFTPADTRPSWWIPHT